MKNDLSPQKNSEQVELSAKVVFDIRLSSKARFLFVAIQSLTSNGEDFPTNDFLCEIMGRPSKGKLGKIRPISYSALARYLAELIKYDYLPRIKITATLKP